MYSNKDLFDKVIRLILKEVSKNDDGFSCASDVNNDMIKQQVKFFQYGLSCKFPPEWEHYKKSLDPEYMEYLRLKSKFRD